jgi:hypothetical protein
MNYTGARENDLAACGYRRAWEGNRLFVFCGDAPRQGARGTVRRRAPLPPPPPLCVSVRLCECVHVRLCLSLSRACYFLLSRGGRLRR